MRLFSALFRLPDIDRLKAARDIPSLVKALQHKDDETREKARGALLELKEETAAHLPKMLRKTRKSMRPTPWRTWGRGASPS